jgi:hypothetical protein
LIRRTPTAPSPVRWVWARGRIILAIVAILDIALLLISLTRRWEINDQALYSVFAMVIDAYFLVYILVARRVRHAFADFPAP